MINLNQINIAKSIQGREHIVESKVDQYAEDMERGDVFAPVVLFRVDGELLLADGWHRYYAHKKLNKFRIDEDIRNGTYVDYLFYIGESNNHGMPFTNADKRRILALWLEQFEIELLSDTEIAKRLRVSQRFVNEHRKGKKGDTIEVKRNGKTFTRKATTNKPKKEEEPKVETKEIISVEFEHTKEDENFAAIDYLTKENEKLKEKVALAFMEGDEDDKAKAQQLIDSLKEEIRLLQIDNRALKAGMDKYQREASQLRKQVAMLERQIKKQ